MNTNISSMQTIVNALQQNDYITGVTPIIEGEATIGYTITFAQNSPITIYKGQDSEDGTSPKIGIRLDKNNIYYWTLNGEWLTNSEGGKNTTISTGSIIPQLKIENEHWWISCDKGKTWTDYGQAKGDKGYSFFKDIDTSSNNYIIITFSDNSTIKLPKLNPLEIHFDAQDLITISNKGSRDIHYTINNADAKTTVEIISSTDLKAKVIQESPSEGVIHIEALSNVDEYSHVLVFVSDSVSRISMAKLTFEESVIKYDCNSNYEVTPEEGSCTIYFLTNTEYDVIIEETASSWISIATQSRSVENHKVILSIQQNTGETRTGTVIIRDKHSNMQLIYTIVQTAPLEILLKKERVALMDLYNSTNGILWTNQTNWGSDKPVSEWYGINCHEDGLICDIYLKNNNLQGEIPASIGVFSKLFSLTLEENQLTGELPQEIGNLKFLNSIRVFRNELSGLLPESLKYCQNISYLDIRTNNFTQLDNIINVISQLSKLNHVKISHNSNLCGFLPATITKIMDLPHLIDFEISHCGFEGNLPPTVLQHPRWNDFAFYILPQATVDNQPNDIPIGGFNMEGVMYKIADFSVKNINDATLDSRVLKQNKLTLIFPVTSGNEYGLRKTQTLHEDYREKGLGIISFFRLWYPRDPAEKVKEEKWVRDMIKKYDMTWHNFIEDGDNNRIHNLPRYWTKSFGTDNSYPSGCIIVDSEGYVLYNADIDGTDGVRDFIESMLGRIDTYESSDYSRDGEIKTIQTASLGNGIDLVLLGDGFTDRDIADGSYDQIMEKAAENFFSSEPIASYRSYFNARSVKVVSKHGRFSDGHETALSCKFEGGTLITGDDNKCMEYAQKISNYDPSRTVILVVLNDNRYAGTCYMYHANNLSIAYCPTVDGYSSERFVQIINHEAVGHGFAKLGDEYYHEQNGAIPVNVIENYRQQQTNGWWNNIDFTTNPEEISWKSFLTDNRYRTENLGIFEGALTYPQNVYKSTTNSIMNTNTGIFNAPSREAIYKRIMQLVHGNDWQYSYEDFVTQDLKNIPSATSKARMPQRVPAEFVPLHPPVVKR